MPATLSTYASLNLLGGSDILSEMSKGSNMRFYAYSYTVRPFFQSETAAFLSLDVPMCRCAVHRSKRAGRNRVSDWLHTLRVALGTHSWLILCFGSTY